MTNRTQIVGRSLLLAALFCFIPVTFGIIASEANESGLVNLNEACGIGAPCCLTLGSYCGEELDMKRCDKPPCCEG